MNILFLSIGRMNSIEDKGIYTDLLRTFRNEGHKVYIVTPREKRLNKPTEYLKEDGVEFLKVRIGNITKVKNLEKGISTLRIEKLFLNAIKEHLNDVKFDLVIYSTPPITFEKVIKYIKKRDRAKSYLLLKDIFPQNAVDLNMFSKKSPVYKFFRYKEKKLYSQSDYIGCMSPANKTFLLSHNIGIPNKKVDICPNSIEPTEVKFSKDQLEKIRVKYKVPVDKVVFIYGGNLGKPQGIDYLINCLEVNKENQKIHFIIAGSGTEYTKIQSYFRINKPKNAQLFKQLPKDDYEKLATSCDVGLIFLDNRFTIPNFPSRLLSYMQASMPILAATDSNTDIGKIIEQGNFGHWCKSDDVQGFRNKIDEFLNENQRKVMGENSREYLENHYTVKHSYEIIMSHFN